MGYYCLSWNLAIHATACLLFFMLFHQDSEEDTPLFNAVWVNRGDIVDILLAAGSRPHETNSRGFNAIHHAAFKGSRL